MLRVNGLIMTVLEAPRNSSLTRNRFLSYEMAYAVRAVVADAADDGLWSVAWSHSGSIVAGSCDETVRSFVLVGEGEKLALVRQHDLRGHELGVTSVTTSAEGGLAASSALDSHIRVWSLEHGTEALSIDAGPVEAWTVCFSADGKRIASGAQPGHVNMWCATSGQRLFSVPTGANRFVMSVAMAPDGRHVACGTAEGGVYVLDVEAKLVTQRFEGHSANVRALAFSADGAHLITGADDAHVNLYELSTGLQVASMPGHASWVLGVAAAPDGSVIASCSADKSVRIWDVGTRQSLQVIADAHTEQAWGVAFDPNNPNRLVSVGDDKALRLYER